MKVAKKIFETARSEGRTFVLEHEAKDIMKSYGIPIPPYATASSVEEAVKGAKEIGFPVVLKILSKDILHKSDAGGVKVNLKTDDDVRKAFDEIMTNAKKYGEKKGIEVDLSRGVFISQFADMGTEVIIGVTRDPQFGHAIMFGLGGIFVEVLKDVTFRLIPFTEADAKEMVGEIKAAKILEGVRGQAPRDVDALVQVMMGVSRMVSENPEISELDCNPTFVYEKGKGALVVDARILIEANGD
jgi:acyl-CoA synthetase (NDP forming)